MPHKAQQSCRIPSLFRVMDSSPSFFSLNCKHLNHFCFSHTPHSIWAEPFFYGGIWKGSRGDICCSSIQKYLACKDSLSFPQSIHYLKADVIWAQSMCLVLKASCLGFPNLGKKTVMSKRLIKAWVSLDHILERSLGAWGCNSLITPLFPYPQRG